MLMSRSSSPSSKIIAEPGSRPDADARRGVCNPSTLGENEYGIIDWNAKKHLPEAIANHDKTGNDGYKPA